MTDDKLDFLDETEGDELQSEVDDTPQVEAGAVDEEATQGAAESEAETGDLTEVPPTPEVTEEPKVAPITALLDEREKRQAAERKAEEVSQRLAQIERQMQQAQQPQQKPDFFDNPDAAIQQQITSVKMQQSRFLAEREFGPEVVAQAYAYFDEHPEESQALVAHPSPFHAAVEHFKKQQFLAEVGADPDAWKQKLREELEQEFASRQPTQPKAPPPTMSRTPTAGGAQVASGNAFDEVFS